MDNPLVPLQLAALGLALDLPDEQSSMHDD